MLRPIFTTVLVFLVSFSSLAQLDSLRALIGAQSGSAKGKTWVNISREYLISGPDSMALVEGRNALTYSQE